MNILITGSTGLVGSNLSRSLTRKNHRILRLVRHPPDSKDQAFWDPRTFRMDSGALEGLDAVVHLAGESITGGRWTGEKKRRIRESRITGTRLLSTSLAALKTPPRVLVSSSAIGYYGDRGEELLDEGSRPGSGFLPDVCLQWEKETDAARAAGIRVVNLRTGIVLSGAGGALLKMLPVFRMGLGGKIGHGRQYMSWIALEDLVGIIEYAIGATALQGPVNAVSPEPVTNRAFSKTLGKVLSRPSVCMLPRFGARLLFGEMADALLLSSTRVVPGKLKETDFRFRFESLEEALRHIFPAR
jgi:uncharacterized protein (TIGR01777 family)